MKKNILTLILILFFVPQVIFPQPYTLAPGDTLEIKVDNQKNMDTKQTIAPDGTVSLPLLGRSIAAGKTLSEYQDSITKAYSKFIQKVQVTVFLTPRPIYVMQHDLKTDKWEVKEAKNIDGSRAFAGDKYKDEIKHGDVIKVDTGRAPDFFEENWYKLITATAVVVGIMSAGR